MTNSTNQRFYQDPNYTQQAHIMQPDVKRTSFKNVGFKSNVVAIINQKGGVGKTTTAVNLATALAACNYRTLLIDLDSQGNASTGLNLDKAQRETSIYQLILGHASFSQACEKTNIPGLDVIPSSYDLAALDIDLVHLESREYCLKNAIQNYRDEYDYILIDCPPALGLVSINALCAANQILIPVQCEFYALEGLGNLLYSIEQIQQRLNQNLQIGGILLTMIDRRNNLSDLVESDVRAYFGSQVLNTVIPRNVRISEAPSHGKPVILYDSKCKGSEAYIQLAREFLQREGRL